MLGGNDVAAEGALTIELQSARLPEFDSYFLRLRPATNGRNPWFREYWERAHDCSFDVDGSSNGDGPRLNATSFAHKVRNITVYHRCLSPGPLLLRPSSSFAYHIVFVC